LPARGADWPNRDAYDVNPFAICTPTLTFGAANKTVDLEEVLQAKPLVVLTEVLRMVTQSDKWQTEVAP